MLIETYKGVEILHDAKLDEFYTNIVVNTTINGKKEYLRNGRLQRLREALDKFLNTAAKKPAIQKAWLKDGDDFELVDVILFSNISKTFMIKKSAKDRMEEFGPRRYGRSAQLFIKCKENDAIVSAIQKANKEKDKIERAVSCSSGKLIPLSEEYTDD